MCGLNFHSEVHGAVQTWHRPQRKGTRGITQNLNYERGFSCGKQLSSRITEGLEDANLLLFPEGKQTHTRHLYHLKSNTGNITLGLTTATETRNENFVVFVDKVETAVVLMSDFQI